MDSFEWNKIIGAVLATGLFLMVLNQAGDILFDVEKPTKQAYVVEGVTPEGEGGTNGEAVAAENETPDFGTLLASADLAAGEKIAARCVQCHTWTKGGENKIGPNLYGIVGAAHAHLGDAFAYSSAMRAFPGNWEYAGLFDYLRNPKAVVPGTKMAFAGIRSPEDRINLIAFMRTWADTPHPLPAPTGPAPTAPTDGTAPAPTEGAPAPAEGTTPAPTETTPAPAPTEH